MTELIINLNDITKTNCACLQSKSNVITHNAVCWGGQVWFV